MVSNSPQDDAPGGRSASGWSPWETESCKEEERVRESSRSSQTNAHTPQVPRCACLVCSLGPQQDRTFSRKTQGPLSSMEARPR